MHVLPVLGCLNDLEIPVFADRIPTLTLELRQGDRPKAFLQLVIEADKCRRTQYVCPYITRCVEIHVARVVPIILEVVREHKGDDRPARHKQKACGLLSDCAFHVRPRLLEWWNSARPVKHDVVLVHSRHVRMNDDIGARPQTPDLGFDTRPTHDLDIDAVLSTQTYKLAIDCHPHVFNVAIGAHQAGDIEHPAPFIVRVIADHCEQGDDLLVCPHLLDKRTQGKHKRPRYARRRRLDRCLICHHT